MHIPGNLSVAYMPVPKVKHLYLVCFSPLDMILYLVSCGHHISFFAFVSLVHKLSGLCISYIVLTDTSVMPW